MGDGWQTKVCIEQASSISASATPLEILSESLAKTVAIPNTMGMYGTRSQHQERSRLGQSPVSGNLVVPWSPAAGVVLLPLVLGAAPSGTTFSLSDTLPEFVVEVDRATKVFTYAECMAAKGAWKGSSGSFVDFTLDILGVDEAIGNAGTGESLTTPIDPPYIFEDAVITVGGTARQIFDFELSVDNKLQARFANSRTATRISPSDLREVALSFNTPFGSDEYDLYNTALAGAAVVLTLTNGAYSTVFTMAAVQFPAMTPVVPGKGEVPLRMQGVARMTSTTKELVVTHDSTA